MKFPLRLQVQKCVNPRKYIVSIFRPRSLACLSAKRPNSTNRVLLGSICRANFFSLPSSASMKLLPCTFLYPPQVSPLDSILKHPQEKKSKIHNEVILSKLPVVFNGFMIPCLRYGFSSTKALSGHVFLW